MPKHYQGESEDSTASKKARLKIKKKKHLPFVKAPANLFKDVPQVRRGLQNPIVPLLKMMEKDLKLKKKQDAEERKRNEEYKKRAKRQDRMS